MNNFAGRTKICKTLKCNKEVWVDGYCKKCADYIIQKQTLFTLEENLKMMKDITTNINFLEVRMSNIENISKSINIPNFQKPDIPAVTVDTFIPSISIATNNSKFINSAPLTLTRDISDIVKKLPNI